MKKLLIALVASLSMSTVYHHRSPTTDTEQYAKELNCLAKNIYFESRGETELGKLAVAQVTLNRVKHPSRFKETICDVVYEYKQFSWTLKQRREILDKAAWEAAVKTARLALSGQHALTGFKATHFHTRQVKPSWRKDYKVVTVIGNHIFYA